MTVRSPGLAGLDHEVWRYTYVLALHTGDPADASELQTNWEAVAAGWFSMDEAHELPLHPDLRRDWSRLRAALPTAH
jgi:hypothetical protein